MIRERNGRLVVTVWSGRDPATGKRRSKSGTVDGTTRRHWTMARRLEDRLLEKLQKAAAAGDDPTVAELTDRWLATAQHEQSTATKTRYELDRYVLPRIGRLRLSEVTAAGLDDLYATLLREGGRRPYERDENGRKVIGADGRPKLGDPLPLAGSTVNRQHRSLHAMFETARRWRLIDENPADFAKPPSPGRPKPDPPPVEDVIAFMAALDKEPTIATIIRTGASTGARRGEVLAIRWTDLNLRARTWTKVAAIKTPTGKGAKPYYGPTKTENRYQLALDRRTVAILRLHGWRMRAQARALGTELVDEAFVFSDEADGSTFIAPSVITQRIRRLRDRKKINPKVKLKGLRNLVATKAMAGDFDPKTGATRLGHARTSTFTDIYAAAIPAKDQELAQYIGDTLDGKGS